ncbi:OmpA family protein [Martelella mangrovi]|uniref:Outer membrane protein OmpA-like peptidoglycan-associated protein n=1 Tax=Martelella mangrovi TaxID=1397477 RepID=A0ABV2IHR2_9HYPH
MNAFFGQKDSEAESEWISISDLMSGLMLIFLFIAIVYLQPLAQQREEAIADKEQLAAIQQTLVQQKEDAIEAERQLRIAQSSVREIVVAWSESEQAIFQALEQEFAKDLPRWNAELDQSSLTLRFKAPDVLFDTSSAALKPSFKTIIDDFFPRYLAVLDRFKDSIDEVRIEGHTSSEWNAETPPLEAYFRNMELSQERTRSVLEYALELPSTQPYLDWALGHVTANGLSSSHLIRSDTGSEDHQASRRVEFRVRTNAKQQIMKVVEEFE